MQNFRIRYNSFNIFERFNKKNRTNNRIETIVKNTTKLKKYLFRQSKIYVSYVILYTFLSSHEKTRIFDIHFSKNATNCCDKYHHVPQ